jgi:tetratricopeptide (TPR) repeat protein
MTRRKKENDEAAPECPACGTPPHRNSEILLLTARAEGYRITGNYVEAIVALSKALSIAPDDAELFFLRGRAFQENFARFSCDKGYNEEKGHEGLLLALEDYSEAIRLNPGYAEAYLERGQIFDAMKNKKKAFADYNKAIKLDPENAVAYFLRGVTYSEKNKTSPALEDLIRAIELDENADYYFERGAIYEGRGDMDNALADYLMAAKLMEKEGDNFYWEWLAEKYGDLGDTRKELEALNEAERVEYQKAIADYSKLIEKNRTNHWHYADRAEYYQKLGNYDAALADYGMAIKNLRQSDDDHDVLASYFYGRGTIYAQMEKHGCAIADFTRALECIQVRYVLTDQGFEFMKTIKYGNAVNDFTVVINLSDEDVNFDVEDPEVMRLIYGLAYSYLKLRDKEKREFETAVRLDPEKERYRKK